MLMPKRILVIDDDPKCRKLLLFRLQGAGYVVSEAEDGEKGLRLAREQAPDLIISDVLLPEIDGFRICEALKQDPACQHIPIIMITAIYVTEEDRRKGLRLGADRYLLKADVLLTKPIDCEELLQHVNGLLGESPPAEPDAEPSDRILLIDGDEEHRDRLAGRLEKEGYEVAAADDYQQGLEQARSATPDLVLLDFQASPPRGSAALAALRQRLPDTAIVLMAEPGSEMLVVDAMRGGANGYLYKPITNGELLPTVRESIEKCRLKVTQQRLIEQLRAGSIDLMRKVDELEKEKREIEYLQEYSSALLESIGACIQVVRDDYSVEYENDLLRERLGSPGVGRKCYELWNQTRPCDQCHLQDCLRAADRSAEGWNPAPINAHCKNRIFSLALSPIRTRSGRLAAVELIRDVTEQKRIEQELIHAAKLASLGTLAGGVAHEFNNIVAGMASHADRALMVDEPERMRKALRDTLAMSDRAAGIVRNLLDFARSDGREKRPVSVCNALEDALNLVRWQLEKGGIQIEADLERTPPVLANQGELQQIFLNILTNARDAMPEGGRLTIRARVETPPSEGREQPGPRIIVSFADTGVGIAEENLSRIFDPFFTTKESYRAESGAAGTGLGLSICYGIIQDYGGKIDVQSKPGSGSTFTIELLSGVASGAVQPDTSPTPVLLRRVG